MAAPPHEHGPPGAGPNPELMQNPMMRALAERLKIAERMKKIKHKLVVMSGKGGVGKSTVSTNLAVALGAKHRVGLLDIDITGPDIPKIVGLEEALLQAEETGIVPPVGYNGVKIMSMAYMLGKRDTAIVWRGPLKMKAINQMLGDVEWGDLDYLILDLPPGTSDEALSSAQNLPDTDGAIIVTTPQEVALLDVRKSIEFAKAVKMPILGVVENMSGFTCPHCGGFVELFKYGGGEKAAKELGLNFLGRVPMDPEIVVGGDAGKPFVYARPDSPAAKAFQGIVKNVESLLAKKEEERRARVAAKSG